VARGSGLGRQRWVVERSFAWLYAFKRLRTRYEHRADIHLGLLQLACALICYRQLLGVLKWAVSVRRAEVPHSTNGAARCSCVDGVVDLRLGGR
jgi:hypothetical protein